MQHRFRPNNPNELLTVDFKGWWYSPNKEKANPLTVRDEYSKMILAITLTEKGDIPNVKAVFERLFTKYSLPSCIRFDNGPLFASSFNALGLPN